MCAWGSVCLGADLIKFVDVEEESEYQGQCVPGAVCAWGQCVPGGSECLGQ